MEVRDLLRQTALFENLTDDEIDTLSRSTTLQTYRTGEVILREGRIGAGFFILVSGRVEALEARIDADPVVLRALGPGDFFGEIATMKHGPRSASVRALEDTVCLVIWRVDFDVYLRRFPDVAAKVESALSARFGDRRERDDRS